MIGIDYKQLVEDVKTADFLLLDDNCVELEIVRIEGEADPLYRYKIRWKAVLSFCNHCVATVRKAKSQMRRDAPAAF